MTDDILEQAREIVATARQCGQSATVAATHGGFQIGDKIRQCLIDPKAGCPCAEAARDILALAQPKWRPISEASCSNKYLLLTDSIGVFKGHFEEGQWFDEYGGELIPTHFMPLPSPPEQEQG